MKQEKKLASLLEKMDWEQDSFRRTTLHKFFDFVDSAYEASHRMFTAGLEHGILIVKNGVVHKYSVKSEWQRYIDGFYRFFNDPKSVKYAHQKMIPESEEFIQWLKSNLKVSALRKCSDKELARILMERHGKHMTLVGWQWFGFTGKHALEQMLSDKLKKYSLEGALQTIFLHDEPIFILKEDLQAKEIAHKVRIGKIHGSGLDVALKRHLAKFAFVVKYDEIYDLMTLESLRKRVAAYAKNKNLKNEIETARSNFKKNKAGFDSLLKEGKFSKDDRNLIIFAHDYAKFMELRNEHRSLAAVHSEQFFRIISGRLGLTTKDLLMFTDYEINDALLGKATISQKEAKARKKHCVLLFDRSRCEIFIGEEAKNIESSILKKHVDTEIKGTVANSGSVHGTVRIIVSMSDMTKLKKGDVLVSSMTRPEFLMAIKRASAIVTDEGGMLCHAAVISRELNKPCIIGTKNATRALKDGDLVEVNANSGVVKIIKKAS